MMPLPTSEMRPRLALRPRVLRAVRELDQARRLGAAGVDAEHAAAPELGERLLVEDLDLEARRVGDDFAISAMRRAVSSVAGALARSRASSAARP